MEWSEYLQFAMALAFVLAMMGLLAFVMRKINDKKYNFLSKQGRLNIIEQKMIDPKHKMVLIRRDNTEHLVILSPHGTLVVENGITPPTQAPLTNSKLKKDIPVESL